MYHCVCEPSDLASLPVDECVPANTGVYNSVVEGLLIDVLSSSTINSAD